MVKDSKHHSEPVIGDNELLFRMHARQDDHDLVSAAVFASKLGTLVRALQDADKAVNHGEIVHDYKIARLASSSPTVLLAEVPRRKFEGRFDIAPSIQAIDNCLEAVISGDSDRAQQFGHCASNVSKLAKDAIKKFGYAEIWTGPKRVFRVDSFLQEQAEASIGTILALKAAKDQWFRGSVFGSFDGEVRFVDTRGEIPEFKLILSAGKQEINCICRVDQFEQLRRAINNRARIFGRAIYDGSSGLPRRVEVSSIELVGSSGDFSRWKGAFLPFEPSTWADGET